MARQRFFFYPFNFYLAMKIVFEDEAFSFELLRAIGYAPYGGADVNFWEALLHTSDFYRV